MPSTPSHKQITDKLDGADGVETWPAGAAPGDGVSLAEVVRQIYNDVTGLIARKGGRLVFASDIAATVAVTSTAGDVALPSVTIPADAIPSGATISRVTAAVSWRKSVESSGSGNAVNVAQTIQVRADTPGTWTDAIDIPDNSLAHAANGTEGGFTLFGDRDVKAEVVGDDDTYEFQWNEADVDGNSITFHDVQTHLIVEYA